MLDAGAAPSATALFTLELAVKATLVLAGALLVARVVRSSASARHLVRWAGFAALLALPVLVVAMPSWGVLDSPWLQAPAGLAESSSGRTARATVDAGAVPAGAGPLAWKADATRRGLTTTAQPSAERGALPVAALLLATWAAVAALLLTRLGSAVRRAHRLAASARALDLAGEVTLLAQSLDIEFDVPVLAHGDVAVPMTLGTLRPAILVPDDFATWDPARRRIVLTHELAHVRRRDSLAQVLGRAAVALYWFHPLAWLAERGLRRDAELAADDEVVRSGTLASDYASHLVAVARALAGARPAALATVPMAGPRLEERVRALLDPHRRRNPMSRTRTSLAIGGVLASLLLLASLGVQAEPEAPAESVKRSSKAQVGDSTPAPKASDCNAGLHSRIISTVHDCLSAFAKMHGHGADSPGDVAFSEAYELYSEGRYEEAAAGFEQAIEQGHRAGICSYNVACCRALQGRTREALDALERSVEACFQLEDHVDSDTDLASLRGNARFERLRDAAHERMAERIAAGDDDAHDDRAEALAELEELRTENSRDASDWSDVGSKLHALGKHALALEAWSHAQDLKPRGATAYNIACAHARLGRTHEAFAALEQAIEAGYSNPAWMSQDADLASLRQDARFETALQSARNLDLNLDPSGRGTSAADWQALVERSEMHLGAHPDSGAAWFNLGIARLRLGELTGSDVAFRRALELGHRPGITQYDLACVAAQRGDADAALDWLARASAAGFDQSHTLLTDPDLDPLRSDPRFEQLAKESDAGLGLLPTGLRRMVVRYL